MLVDCRAGRAGDRTANKRGEVFYMHKITRIQCGNGNCFCIEDGGNAILIDTSRTQYKNKILEICKDKNIRLIVFTHGHVDHIQNAAALSNALKAPIAMHKADYGLIKNNLEEPLSADGLLGKLILALSIKSFGKDTIEPFEPEVFLQDGDSLESYGVRATVIGLPGHTKGSIGIKIGDRDIFVGDALMNMLYPTKSLLYGNSVDMLKSAVKISTSTYHSSIGYAKFTMTITNSLY